MTIRLHIDRLIVDGLDLQHGSGKAVAAAVQRELGRLVGSGGLASWTQAGIAVPSVAAPPIQAVGSPDALGAAIAGAVYSGIGSPSDAASSAGVGPPSRSVK